MKRWIRTDSEEIWATWRKLTAKSSAGLNKTRRKK
jgi:hypothetical protein